MNIFLCNWAGVPVTVLADTETEALSKVFVVCNDESDDRWTRSLSVGDVVGLVRLGENIPQAYRCGEFGWELIKEGARL